MINAINGEVEWNFEYATNDYTTHHDVELLPNGNIIALVWERKLKEEAIEAGSSMGIDIFPEAIIEINPSTNEIVWEWHAWHHLIQDNDETKQNYGVIKDHPELIDINYVDHEQGDIMHANGITYDNNEDVIYLSVNFFNEIWVIDHSTSTEEAASNKGGNYGKGGDLIYRFGNPRAYKNQKGEVLFDRNHHPNLLLEESQPKRMLIFTNGISIEQSTVYELELPHKPQLLPDYDNEPQVKWSFTDNSLFSAKASGAVRLPNGNTLITEGDFGIWEVSPEKEVVWKFEGNGFFWRAYHYNKNDEAILNLDI